MTLSKTLGQMVVAAAIALVSAVPSIAASVDVMKIIGKANPPIGHYEFCQTYASECRPLGRDAGPVALTEEKWRTLLDVNYTVNTTITPMTDQEIYGV